MKRNFEAEIAARVAFIKQQVEESGVSGIVFGNSGGKDSALVGILCKKACPNTVGIILPCGSSRNYGEDREDALALAEQFHIETRTVDLTPVRDAEVAALEAAGVTLTPSARNNIPPRLRMTTLYAVAAAESRLVAGTGNRSERHMGYFTKWGDGAFDFNCIADLTATEILEFLSYLDAPEHIVKKAPSAGLFEGQTDEKEMGVTYAEIDSLLEGGSISDESRTIIDRYHRTSEHKRRGAALFGAE